MGYSQFRRCAEWSAYPREGRYAATHPDGLISSGPECIGWKEVVLGFEFLQAGDIGLLAFEPMQQLLKPLIDVVDVGRRNLHGAPNVIAWSRRSARGLRDPAFPGPQRNMPPKEPLRGALRESAFRT